MQNLRSSVFLSKKTVLASCMACAFTSPDVAAGKLLLSISDDETLRQINGASIEVEGVKAASQIQDGKLSVDIDGGGLFDITVKAEGYIARKLPSVRVLESKTTAISVTLIRNDSDGEEVVVLGSSTKRDTLQSATLNQLNREDLRSAVGSGSDVLRALDSMPGLFSEGQFSSFTVRGNCLLYTSDAADD